MVTEEQAREQQEERQGRGQNDAFRAPLSTWQACCHDAYRTRPAVSKHYLLMPVSAPEERMKAMRLCRYIVKEPVRI